MIKVFVATGALFGAWLGVAIAENTTVSLACVIVFISVVFKAGMELKGVKDKLALHDVKIDELVKDRHFDLDKLRSELRPAIPSQSEPRWSSMKRMCILIVEDEASDRALFHNMLQKRFDIGEAESLTEAISWLKTNEADCVLLDLCLPDSDREESVGNFLRANPGAICLAMSGFEGTENNALKQGADAFLFKGDMLDRAYVERMVIHAITRFKSKEMK